MELVRETQKPLKLEWKERMRQVLNLFCKVNGSEFEKKNDSNFH